MDILLSESKKVEKLINISLTTPKFPMVTREAIFSNFLT